MNFGVHLTIDGYGGDKEKLNNRELVLNCLNELPSILGMKTLAEPCIYFAEGNNLKDPGGWSGFVVIQESHISIHTFPGRKFLSSDVYTCKNSLDKAIILDYFREKFELEDIEDNFIKRGTRYPTRDIL